MNTQTSQIGSYLREALDVSMSFRNWSGSASLPAFMRARYHFQFGRLHNKQVLFMTDGNDNEDTPKTINKHISLVKDKWKHEVVYVRDAITAYNRKRFIQHHIPFVVPNKQMYLPYLGIDLREYYKSKQIEVVALSPATQAIFIHALLSNNDSPLHSSTLIQELGYSAMRINRVFNELETCCLAHSVHSGRERRLQLDGVSSELLQRAIPFMKSPVKSRYYVQKTNKKIGLASGISALSHYSTIDGSSNKVFAVNRKKWNEIKGDFKVVPLADETTIEIEVWSYEPRTYRKKNVVDPLSLFLSLQHLSDERVETALKQIIDGLTW